MNIADGAASGAYKVNSLSGLTKANAVEGELQWDPARSLWNSGFLLIALIFAPFTFTWSAFAVFIFLSGITLCIGHSVGFHRRLIHQSFDCPKWLERFMIWVGVTVGMGGPIWTIGLHDLRDWAQRQPDCHWFLRHGNSLLKDGFYYLNFKLNLKHPPNFDPGPGINDDPFYLFLQRTWMLHQIPIAIVLYLFGGWSWVVWGIFVRVACCFTMHWYIAHIAHTDGHQDWFVDDAAIQGYNVAWLAIPTVGESWHSNHHAFPASARHGLYKGQIDLGYNFIQLLAILGLAKNIKLPENLPPREGLTPKSPDARLAAKQYQ
jgi:stearoyl-CoA desaturase (delta-9 desaturase)